MVKSDNQSQPVELPKVTVVIANHNYGQWLPHAIASVIEQDYPNKRIAIYDDGSADNSLDILKQLLPDELSHNSRDGFIGDVQVTAFGSFDGVQRPAEGPSSARNKLIKSFWESSHLFAILDADDYWMQGKLSQSVACILDNPGVVEAVYTDNYSLNVHNSNVLREYRESFDLDRLSQHNMVHSGCVITKKILAEVGLYDEEMRVAEDYDLWIRIAEKALIYHIPEPLVTIRVGQHNTGNSISPQIWRKNWDRISQKIQKRRQ